MHSKCLGPTGASWLQHWEKIAIGTIPFSLLYIANMITRYPRLSYNAATSTLIIQCAASSMHGSIAPLLADAFHTWRNTLPPDQQHNLSVTHTELQHPYAGPWA